MKNGENHSAVGEQVTPRLGGRNHRPECLCRMCLKVREAWAKRKPESQGKVSGKKLRRQRFIQAYTDGDNPETFGNATKAAMAAGYSELGAATTGKNLLRESETRAAILAALERQGITDDYLAEKMKEGLEAKEIKFFSHEGKVTDQRECADYYARHKYLETAHRIRGELRQDAPIAQAALILRVPAQQMTEEEWNAQVATEEEAEANTGAGIAQGRKTE